LRSRAGVGRDVARGGGSSGAHDAAGPRRPPHPRPVVARLAVRRPSMGRRRLSSSWPPQWHAQREL